MDTINIDKLQKYIDELNRAWCAGDREGQLDQLHMLASYANRMYRQLRDEL